MTATLGVEGAEFSMSEEAPGHDNPSLRRWAAPPQDCCCTPAYPVDTAHGRRLGHIPDSDGLHWEIGRTL